MRILLLHNPYENLGKNQERGKIARFLVNVLSPTFEYYVGKLNHE